MEIDIYQSKGAGHTLCEDTVSAGNGLFQGVAEARIIETLSSYPITIAALDGVGGEHGGREASSLIGRLLMEHPFMTLPDDKELWNVVQEANRELLRYAERRAVKENDSSMVRMGTTVAGLIVSSGSFEAFWAGNTRIYHIHDDEIEQVSADQTDAFGRLTGGLGAGTETFSQQLQIKCLSHKEGDRFLLTTDGIHDHLAEEVLEKVVLYGAPDLLMNLTDTSDDRTIVWVQT